MPVMTFSAESAERQRQQSMQRPDRQAPGETENAQIDDPDRAEQQRHADEVQSLEGREQPRHVAHDLTEPGGVQPFQYRMH